MASTSKTNLITETVTFSGMHYCMEAGPVTCGVPEDLYLGWESTVRHLTRRGQTRKRSLDPRWPLVTPKVQVIIATWNVRTLNKVGKTAQFTTEMRKYVTDILGISECRSVLDSSEQSLVIQFFTPEEMMPLIMVGWHLR